MSDRGQTARKVVALADGTRTVRQIAEELGVMPEYVHATIRRQGIRDRVLIRSRGTSIKSYARQMKEERDYWKSEAERLATLPAVIAALQAAAEEKKE